MRPWLCVSEMVEVVAKGVRVAESAMAMAPRSGVYYYDYTWYPLPKAVGPVSLRNFPSFPFLSDINIIFARA